MDEATHKKLWGGRFATPTSADMAAFNDSFRFDQRLADVDIEGSIAWASALWHEQIITDEELDQLLKGFEQVRQEFTEGRFVSHPSDEDIHTAIERRLGELIGAPALKLHTGRSRNDQVATDTRLFCRHAVQMLLQRLQSVQAALVGQARAHTETLMPGYTHLQRAQPITFGHWCLAYVEMFERDKSRLRDADARMSVLPLGCGALAGNTLVTDREWLLNRLDFSALAQNSLDAISDRDFIAELLFCGSMIGIHLSRMAEDLIFYSSAECGFVELADGYSTGSSMMPQKKNPDSMELLRGKSGRLIGNLVGLLTVLKGLPLAYNKDLQEDKEPLFDSIDTLDLGLRVAAGALATMHIFPSKMSAALDDTMLATDLADELVRQGVPFREAHRRVGALVRESLACGTPLRDLPPESYERMFPEIDPGTRNTLDHHASVAQKNAIGGTAPARVEETVRAWQERLESEMGQESER